MPRHSDPRWVESATAVAEVVAACREAGRFALDTEADSLHSYFHKVCLVQVTAAGATFLVDPLALTREALAPLWEVLADPSLPVFMHGADYDMRVLDRDHEAFVRGLRDTQIMAQLLGERRTGLAALLEQELGVALDKSLQRADWSLRPLPPPLLRYAGEDTVHLERLAGRLTERLGALGRWSWAREEFERMEKVRHCPAPPDPLVFERIEGARGLEPEARDRLHALHCWREAEARRLDVPPFKVLGGRPMLALARTPPCDLTELARVDGLGPRFARRWGQAVLRCLVQPDAAPPPAPRRPRVRPDHARQARVQRLLAVRDRVAADLGLDPGVVCPRAVLEAVGEDARPAVADLERRGLTGWRLELLGEQLAEALAESP